MSDERHPPAKPDQEPGPRPSPRRGAFPTPASEVERATPYEPPTEVDDPAPDEPADPNRKGGDQERP